MAFQPTFGRCAENAENMLTFGRWNRHDVSANVATICPGAVAFLSTFGRCVENAENMLAFGRWNATK